MLRQKDIEILHHLRNNSRQSLTSISKKMKIPVTTVYDRVLANEKKFITRHTSLLNFPNIGLNSRMFLNVKVQKNKIIQFENFLKAFPGINSAYKTDFDGNYFIEMLSKDSSDANASISEIENKFSIKKTQIFNIIEELQKESILTKPEHITLFSSV